MQDPLDRRDGRADSDDGEGELDGLDVRAVRQDQTQRQDHQPDLARHDPDRRHARPGGEAETLGLRPHVAHHERGAHRRGGEDRDTLVTAQDRTSGDAEVDDGLTPPVEDGVHEGPEPADLAGRPGERAVEHVEDAADEHDDTADGPIPEGDQAGAERR